MIRIGDGVKNAYLSNEMIEHKSEPTPEVKEKECECDSFVRSFISHDYDIEFLRKVDANTAHKSYILDFWKEMRSYLKETRKRECGFGFDDMVTAGAVAYSRMYNRIVEGYKDKTREMYIWDKEFGGYRTITMEEDLERLNRGYDELIEYEKMASDAMIESALVREQFHNEKIDDSFKSYDKKQARDYIEEIANKLRSIHDEQYKKQNGNVDMEALVSNVLSTGNQGMYKYCKYVFGKSVNSLMQLLGQ